MAAGETYDSAPPSQAPDLATDRPTATEILEIVAETLTETVVPATAPHAQHGARVAANLCLILARELTTGRSTAPPLPASLITCDDVEAEAATPLVLELVRAKLDVNKPGYDAHDAEAEANVIA